MNKKIDSDDEESDDVIRSAQTIAKRIIVLHGLLSAAHGSDKQEVLSWLDAESLMESISPAEFNFFQESESAEQIITNATWRLEALVPLAWAIGLIADIDSPTDLCDVDRLIVALPAIGSSTSDFISKARLRTEEEISREYEKTYKSHWEVRDAQINNRKVPNKLNPSVVRERHYGFNWVIGYCGLEWDDITTDT